MYLEPVVYCGQKEAERRSTLLSIDNLKLLCLESIGRVINANNRADKIPIVVFANVIVKVFPLVLSPCVFTLIFRNHVAEASVLLEYIVYLIIMNRFDHCVILLAYYAPIKLWSKANRASLISKTL